MQLRRPIRVGLATVAEAVAYLGKSRRTLYLWARLGRVRFIRPFPRMVRIAWRQLKRLKRQLTREG